MSRVRKSASAYGVSPKGNPRFQHWYRDNQVYFITARTRGGFPAFTSNESHSIFWQQFDKYTRKHSFFPWVTSLLTNHWHTIGYLRRGDDLSPMMNGIQGSVAKLVNDVLANEHRRAEHAREAITPPLNEQARLVPFWYDSHNSTYFDGCLRDELQATRTFRYVHTQCRRHRLCDNPADYPNTRIDIPLEKALRRATELQAFLYGVRYRRYQLCD